MINEIFERLIIYVACITFIAVFWFNLRFLHKNWNVDKTVNEVRVEMVTIKQTVEAIHKQGEEIMGGE